MPVEYVIKVRNKNNVEIGKFDTVRDIRFGKRLNNTSMCEFTVPANNPKALSLISLRKNSVWIYRVEGTKTTLLWSGEQFLRRGQLASNGANWVTIFCYDWLEQLNHKYTSSYIRYEGLDAGEIARRLIGDSYGITTGTIVPTQPRNREYSNQNVMEALINLSNVIGGSDFEINNAKVFNWKPIGIDRSDSVIFEYGVNITDCTIDEDFSMPINRAIVLGQADETGDLVRADVDNTPSQTAIGLREYVDTEIDISETLTFTEKGEALIRKNVFPLIKIQTTHLPSVRPKITEFAVGDTVWLIIKNGIYDINEKYRIFEWQLNFRPDNTEQLTLVFGKFTL